jgi:hypothetical protein
MPKLCIIKECKKVAVYGYEKGIGLYCKTHKTDNMINIKKHYIVINIKNTK